jgi:hypothetical protein
LLKTKYKKMADTFTTDTTTKPTTVQVVEGLAISAAVLFATIWVISKAWSSGQNK